MKAFYLLTVLFFGFALTGCDSDLDGPTPPEEPATVYDGVWLLEPTAVQGFCLNENPVKLRIYNGLVYPTQDASFETQLVIVGNYLSGTLEYPNGDSVILDSDFRNPSKVKGEWQLDGSDCFGFFSGERISF